MNTHDKGKQLEIYVAEKLQDIFQEIPPIRPSKASSGGQRNTEIGDITSQNVFVEIKNDGKFFNKRVWSKLLNFLPFGTKKVPLYIINHAVEGKLICLSFNDFCRLLKKEE